MLLKIFSPAALLYRLFIEANFSVTSNSTLLPQEDNWAVLVIFVNLARVQENHSKPHALLINIDIEPKVLNSSSKFLSHKVTVLNNFVFSEHISSTAAIKHYLNSPSINVFSGLANKQATWKLTLDAPHFRFSFLGRNCCNEILSFKFSHFLPLLSYELGVL